MAEVDAKVNMSLDDIIKMEKKKKAANPNRKRGGPFKGAVRGGKKQGAERVTNGNTRGRNGRPVNQGFNNKRGQPKKQFAQNNIRGGFVKKRFNNGTIKSNLTRSQSNLSLNKLNLNNSRGPRGGFGSRRGGKLGLNRSRSRSRTNLAFSNNKSTNLPKNKGFLKRTNSMPNLRDPSSVYNRLGYQSPAQIAYRNRVKRTKNALIQRQGKAMRMQNIFGLSPTGKVLSSLDRKMSSGRRYNAGSLRSDQLIRAQRRAQYEQKLMRMGGVSRANMSNIFLNAAYNANRQHQVIDPYTQTMQTSAPLMNSRNLSRGRSPFAQSLQNFKASTMNLRQRQKRARSRSRSRSRVRPAIRNNISLDDMNLQDGSFKNVMHGLYVNGGFGRQTLNDRFSFLNENGIK